MLLLLLMTAATAAFAQSEPAEPQYEEEIEVRVIDVDVVVTDRRGNPLTGLTRENFELYENGKRVEIDYFTRIADGRIQDVPVPAGEVALELPRRPPVTWVVYVDHTNMSPQSRNASMQHLQVFLPRAINHGDRGLIALNDGRTFRIRQNVTADHKELMAVLAKMARERMSVSTTRSRTAALLNHMRRSEAEMGAPVQFGGEGDAFLVRDETEYMAQTSGGEIASIIQEQAARTKGAIHAMGALLDALAHVEGRIALVYVGGGFNSLPAMELAEAWRARYSEALGRNHPSEPKPEEEQLAIEREVSRLLARLGTSRVTLYTIHAGERFDGAGSVDDPGMTTFTMETPTGITALTEAGHARDVAERTGGLYFRTAPGLADRLEAARSDFDNYYSLGYTPKGRVGDTRKVEVKVDVDGARVRHRESVRERTRAEEAAGVIVRSMVQPLPRAARRSGATPDASDAVVAETANPLGVSVEANVPRGTQYLMYNFSLQLESLTFVRHGSDHRARFVMHFALVGRDGTIYPLVSREQTLTTPATGEPFDPTSLVIHSWHLDVSPIRVPPEVPIRQKGMRLAVTVEDRFSDRRSIVMVPLGEN